MTDDDAGDEARRIELDRAALRGMARRRAGDRRTNTRRRPELDVRIAEANALAALLAWRDADPGDWRTTAAVERAAAALAAAYAAHGNDQ